MNNNTSLTAYDEMPENIPQTDGTENATSKKNIAYRVLGAIVAAFAIGLVFLPWTLVIVNSKLGRGSLFDAIRLLFSDTPFKLFGIIPALTETNSINGLFATISLYLLLLCSVITIVLGIITVFCSKKAPAMLRVTVFFLAIGYAIYMLLHLLVFFVFQNKIYFDYVCIGAMAAMAILFFVLACVKLGSKALVNTCYWILSAIVSAAIVLTIAKDASSFTNGLAIFKMSKMNDIIVMAVVGVCVVNLVIASIRVSTKKGLIPDLVRYCILLVVAGFILFFQIKESNDLLAFICSIVAVVVAVLQIVICSLHLARGGKKAAEGTEELEEDEDAVAAEEVAENEYVVEQFAEAMPYDGGPVEGVQVAELVAEETPEPAPVADTPKVETADYDFYNTKSFDPFIAILSSEERNQFTELFILRYKGTMPEIPDYTVGANNKEFFRKVFIYLGQYRDRIPDGLLSKMYDFSIKL